MRTITINNYEEFIIDYIDGKLCAEKTADLLLFVEQYPTIKVEFELLDTTPIAPQDTITYTNKNKLKKETTYTNETIVAYVEGDLSPTETLAFEKALAANAKLQSEWVLFNKTIAVTDDSIVYAYKRKLKKENKVLWLWTYGAAASVAIAMLVYSVVNNDRNMSQQVANNVVIKAAATNTIRNATAIVVPITTHKFNNTPRKKNTTSTTINKATLPVITSNELTIIKTEIDTTVVLPVEKVVVPIAYTLTDNYSITTITGKGTIATITETNKYMSVKEITKQKLNNFLANKLGIKRKPNADGTLVAYQVSVGQFEFSHTVSTEK